MRRLAVLVMLLVVVALVSLGCKKSEILSDKQLAQRQLQSNADNVVAKIQYIKDPRTGLVFAYYWGGQANGGPALTVVPEASVPKELVTVAK
jgi:hypothetical protein